MTAPIDLRLGRWQDMLAFPHNLARKSSSFAYGQATHSWGPL